MPVPGGVTATVEGQRVSAKGPKGELSVVLHDDVKVEQTDEGISIMPRTETKRARSMWGMSRTMVSNIVGGVSEGFQRRLEIQGVGYRAQLQGKNLQLALGFSHEVLFPIPEGITIEVPRPTEILVSGIDKQRVGQVAANIRDYRPPEPYKGKGVRYGDEFVMRKEGKKK
ncbi:LSU ribosomal protein L6p (L9e) [Lutibaculum baratangense AMV1]|uniref:Large ribosomal subunit protein uL6 n=1 Tax=Lutibaculum baratangense AMV1 TaxID=631454 RepID=V4R3K6_9HYPH|nr:LSU ribosomal protein L6p (L9e) [Lutibaculum baratangense AMV1]